MFCSRRLILGSNKKLDQTPLSPGHYNLEETLSAPTGIIKYTVGQRKGLCSPEPMFVLNINAYTNSIIVGPREALRQAEFHINDVNWLDDMAFDKLIGSTKKVLVKTRYQRTPVMADVTPLPNKKALVTLYNEEEPISPGQACVFYCKEKTRVLGGGWITNEFNFNMTIIISPAKTYPD